MFATMLYRMVIGFSDTDDVTTVFQSTGGFGTTLALESIPVSVDTTKPCTLCSIVKFGAFKPNIYASFEGGELAPYVLRDSKGRPTQALVAG